MPRLLDFDCSWESTKIRSYKFSCNFQKIANYVPHINSPLQHFYFLCLFLLPSFSFIRITPRWQHLITFTLPQVDAGTLVYYATNQSRKLLFVKDIPRVCGRPHCFIESNETLLGTRTNITSHLTWVWSRWGWINNRCNSFSMVRSLKYCSSITPSFCIRHCH